ncbi:hypothetical protein FBY22_6602 [Streptomyces sp. SLBN-31]|nr:hypothetical protein FBY22_6602 [Streptomyces sp. SLBN-31]
MRKLHTLDVGIAIDAVQSGAIASGDRTETPRRPKSNRVNWPMY